jgi:hypothetical protein
VIGEAREWIATHVPTAARSVSTSLETAGQTLRLYVTPAIASAGPHWREIAAAIVVVLVAGVIMSVLHAQRRRELLEQSLVEAKLGHDPKTDWLELQIVMRNLQKRALLVHSIQVIDPPGTMICERWQAWRADGMAAASSSSRRILSSPTRSPLSAPFAPRKSMISPRRRTNWCATSTYACQSRGSGAGRARGPSDLRAADARRLAAGAGIQTRRGGGAGSAAGPMTMSFVGSARP